MFAYYVGRINKKLKKDDAVWKRKVATLNEDIFLIIVY